MPMRATRAALLFLVPGLALIPAAGRAESTFPQEKVCTANGVERIIHKDALAEHLVKTFPINLTALPDTGQVYKRSEIPRLLLANPKTCADETCSAADATNLAVARGAVLFLMDGRDGTFAPTARVTPTMFFGSPNEIYKIRCLGAGEPAPKPPTLVDPALSKSKSDLRIRGKTDDLFVRRVEKDKFKAASAASVNLVTDEEAKKSTATLQGVVGYAVPVGDTLDLIPYVRADTSAVRTGSGKTRKATSAEIYGIGTMASQYFFISPWGNILNVRPDLLINTDDDSRILSFNIQYIPILNGVLNDFITIGRNFVSIKPTLDLRWNSGWYLEKGIPIPDMTKEDFSRVGGMAGIVVDSDNKSIPISLSSTYTLLRDINGGVDIGYFANTLSWHLDPDKYFGLSASYVSGRREDTAKEEQIWKIGLTGKF
ncbi:MAG: hypothetical protein ACAH24_22160 [Hyphomicrobiaceae bacterium]